MILFQKYPEDGTIDTRCCMVCLRSYCKMRDFLVKYDPLEELFKKTEAKGKFKPFNAEPINKIMYKWNTGC